MIKLYAHSDSPYSQRVRLLLAELQLPYDLISINFSEKNTCTDRFESLQPFGRVPRIQWGEVRISESLAICRYLIGRTKSQHLYPSNLEKRAEVDEWIDYTNIHLGLAFTNLAWHRYWSPIFGTKGDPHHIKRLEKRIIKELPILETKLANNSFIMGEALSLCDISLFPQILVHQRAGIELANYPKILEWINLMANRNSWNLATG